MRLGFCAVPTILPMRQWVLLLNMHSDWLNFTSKDAKKDLMQRKCLFPPITANIGRGIYGKHSMHLFLPKQNQLHFCSKPGYPPLCTLKPHDATPISGFLTQK